MDPAQRANLLESIVDYSLTACPLDGGIPSEHDLVDEDAVLALAGRAAEVLDHGTPEEREVAAALAAYAAAVCPIHDLGEDLTYADLDELQRSLESPVPA